MIGGPHQPVLSPLELSALPVQPVTALHTGPHEEDGLADGRGRRRVVQRWRGTVDLGNWPLALENDKTRRVEVTPRAPAGLRIERFDAQGRVLEDVCEDVPQSGDPAGPVVGQYPICQRSRPPGSDPPHPQEGRDGEQHALIADQP
jgi:hypothetical protein